MKLLIIEDEKELSGNIAAYMSSENYVCEQAFSYDEALTKQELLYGKSGIFKRCVDLTVEFKLEQGRFGETCLLLPREYLRVSQCPNFILEYPETALERITEFDEALQRMFETTDRMEIIGPSFKEKLHRQLGSNRDAE